jgi:ParB family chromosome partitioning protein
VNRVTALGVFLLRERRTSARGVPYALGWVAFRGMDRYARVPVVGHGVLADRLEAAHEAPVVLAGFLRERTERTGETRLQVVAEEVFPVELPTFRAPLGHPAADGYARAEVAGLVALEPRPQRLRDHAPLPGGGRRGVATPFSVGGAGTPLCELLGLKGVTAPALGGVATPPTPGYNGAMKVPIDLLVSNPYNPRAVTKPDPALVASVRAHGIIEPLVVRPLGDGRYEIVAGERRYRAALEAGLTEVPVVVREADDQEAFALAMAENTVRRDLDPLEVLEGVLEGLRRRGFSQEEAEELVRVATNALRKRRESGEARILGEVTAPLGVSPYTLINYSPLLDLPAEVRAALKGRGIPLKNLLKAAQSPKIVRKLRERLQAWRKGEAPTLRDLSPEESLAALFRAFTREEQKERKREPKPMTDVERLVWGLEELVRRMERIRGTLPRRFATLLLAALDEGEEWLLEENARELPVPDEGLMRPLREKLARIREAARRAVEEE